MFLEAPSIFPVNTSTKTILLLHLTAVTLSSALLVAPWALKRLIQEQYYSPSLENQTKLEHADRGHEEYVW